MRKLYTLAFPTLNDADARFVGAIRARHDRHSGILGPHFTLLFGCDAVDEATCIDHVRAIAAATRAFAIHCSDAEPDADDDGKGVVYLVPDVGRDGVTALHDALYTGPMAPFLRADRAFVAHMTVGHAADVAAAERLSDALNTDGIDVRGSVDAVVVGCVEHGRWVELARFALRH
jgi:2'-5' RNA ligase